MAIQNVIGDSFRGATWVAIHNGGGRKYLSLNQYTCIYITYKLYRDI